MGKGWNTSQLLAPSRDAAVKLMCNQLSTLSAKYGNQNGHVAEEYHAQQQKLMKNSYSSAGIEYSAIKC